MPKGKKLSEETKKKISESLMGHEGFRYWLGKHLSNETKKKLSIANKGKHLSLKTEFKKGMKLSEETKKKISKANKGNKHSEETKRKIGIANSGKSHSEETKRKLSELNKGKKLSDETKKKIGIAGEGRKFPKSWFRKQRLRKGEDGGNWKGGITPENKRIRNSIDFRLWREAVFARDNWICQKCKQRGEYLHPHHIKNFAQFVELRFAIDNGITLCKKCHKLFHKRYGKMNNTRKQLEKFISEGDLIGKDFIIID